MAGRKGAGLEPFFGAFVALAFCLTALGVLGRRQGDPLLRVEGWAGSILAAAAEADLRDPFVLAGLVYTESRGRPEAQSSAGALGLCQLLPETAAEVARRHGIAGPPFTPEDNLRLGARYLAEQLERWGGDVDLALLSYRLGPSAVRRQIEASGGRETWLQQLRLEKPSAWEYRTQVLRLAERFQERAAAGIGWPRAEPALARTAAG